MIDRRYWTLLLCVVGILFMITASGTARACSFASPEPWFKEYAVIEPLLTLPPGVDVRVLDDSTTIEFQNTSNTELLIVGQLRGVFWQDSPSDFPQAGEPPQPVLHRIINGKAFSWSTSATQREWVQKPSSPNTVKVNVRSGVVGTDDALLGEYTNFNTHADGRPNTVVLPPAQQLTVHVVHGTNVLNIPLKIEYKLNPAYDPHGEQYYNQAMAECAERMAQEFASSLSPTPVPQATKVVATTTDSVGVTSASRSPSVSQAIYFGVGVCAVVILALEMIARRFRT